VAATEIQASVISYSQTGLSRTKHYSTLAFLHLCVRTFMIKAFLVRTCTDFATFSFGWNWKWTSYLLYYMKENLFSILLRVKQVTSFS